MTNSSPNQVFIDTAEHSAKKLTLDKKRKARDDVKVKRCRSEYTRTENDSNAPRSAYSRHDVGTLPDEYDDDVSQDYLEQLKTGFCTTKVVVTLEEAKEIEKQTQDQADNEQWIAG